jgi:hypothetical protein
MPSDDEPGMSAERVEKAEADGKSMEGELEDSLSTEASAIALAKLDLPAPRAPRITTRAKHLNMRIRFRKNKKRIFNNVFQRARQQMCMAISSHE